MFRLASMLTLAVCAAGVIGTASAQPPEPVPMIQVTAAAEVATVQAVNDALSALSRKVTACVEGGRKLEACQCSAPQELTNLRSRYDSLIERHPVWKEQVVSYQYIDEDGRNISSVLALSTLRVSSKSCGANEPDSAPLIRETDRFWLGIRGAFRADDHQPAGLVERPVFLVFPEGAGVAAGSGITSLDQDQTPRHVFENSVRVSCARENPTMPPTSPPTRPM